MNEKNPENLPLSKIKSHIRSAVTIAFILIAAFSFNFFFENHNQSLNKLYNTISTHIGNELMFLVIILLACIIFYYRIKNTISKFKDLDEQDKQRAKITSEKSKSFALPPGITTIIIGFFLVFFSSDISVFILEDLLHTPIKQMKSEPFLETTLLESLFENPFIQVKTITVFVGWVALIGGGALLIRNIQNKKTL